MAPKYFVNSDGLESAPFATTETTIKLRSPHHVRGSLSSHLIVTRGCPSKDAHRGVIENQISLKKRMRNILKGSVSNSEHHRFLLTSGEGHVKNSVRKHSNLSKIGSRRSFGRPVSNK